eukprot:101160_1
MNRPRRNVPPPSISSSQATRKIKLGRNHQCQNLPRVLSPSERQQHVDAYASSREQNSSESPSKSAQISKKTETSPNIKSIQPPSTRSPPPSPPNTRARLLDLTVWHTPFPAHMQWDTDLFVGFARKRKRSRRTVQMGSASISEWKEFSFADHFNNRDQFFDMNPLPESKKSWRARTSRIAHLRQLRAARNSEKAFFAHVLRARSPPGLLKIGASLHERNRQTCQLQLEIAAAHSQRRQCACRALLCP